MYNKQSLLEILDTQNRFGKIFLWLFVKPYTSRILKALKDDDKILTCSLYCFLNGDSGFYLLLQDRILFIIASPINSKKELYLNNVASYTKSTGLLTSVNITDAGGKSFNLENISEECADITINHLNSLKEQILK